MTLALRAFLIAIFATLKRWKVVVFLYFINLLFGILIAWPLLAEVARQGGHFGAMEGLVRAFDPELYLDFANGREGGLGQSAALASLVGIFYFLVFNAVSGGVIALLLNANQPTTLKTFFRSIGDNCFRFFRLLFYYVVILAVVALINVLLNDMICWFFGSFLGGGGGTVTLGWSLLVKNIVMLLILLYALVSFNYAKTSVVAEDGHSMFFHFFKGMGFTASHPLSTIPFFLFSLIPFVAVGYLYWMTSRTIDPYGSYALLEGVVPWKWVVSGSVIYVIVAQLTQFFLQGCLVMRYAGQVYIFKRLMIFTAHPDPDLEKSIPESYFVVDRPDPLVENGLGNSVEGK